MADYNAKIKVSADTKQAESEITKLQKKLDQLSAAAFKLDARNFRQGIREIGTAVQGIGQRGALGALTLAAGKATTAIGGLGAKFGILGAAAASAGATVNSALGGVPGVITDILNQVGQVPNAFGIAAVAAMAFAPQILKASSAAVQLGAAVDKAVGTQTTQKIAELVDNVGKLTTEINATASAFSDLISGSTLNQLNSQLKDAVYQSGEFHSSTVEAVIAAEQLVSVQKEQRKEQRAINDLIRQAQGLQPQDVRDTEVARRVALLKSKEIQQRKDVQLQNQINAELADYERIAAQVAAQTKLWADNLDRIARSSRSGALGSQTQIRTRLQEFQANRRSADIARQRSAELLAREQAMAGGQYSLSQVPARGELFPGGRTETAASQYRDMLNEQARIRAAAADALAKSERTVIGLQAQTLKTEQAITAAKRQQQSVDERSIQIAKERNKLLMDQYKAEQRVAAGVLDPASLRADRQRRVEQGRAAQQRRRDVTENAIIGGAFPMLFGGGPGAVIGGAAGGFIPGNPMLSIATSAVGTLVDQFAMSVTELGKNMRDPIENFKKLSEAGLLASRSQQRYIEQLIAAGRITEAVTAIQSELIKKIGIDGVRNLQNAGAASDKFNKALTEFSLQIQAAVAGPLAALLSWLAGIVSIGNRVTQQAAQQSTILKGLSPNDRSALQSEEQRILSGANIFNEAAKRKQVEQLYQDYTSRSNVKLPGTTSDLTAQNKAAGQTKELQAQVELEAKKLTLVGMSLEKNGQAYKDAAKAVALQEYRNKLLEIQNSWIGQAYDAERNTLMIREANLQYAGKLKAIDAERVKNARDELDIRKSILGLQVELLQVTLAAGDADLESTSARLGEIASLKEALSQQEARFLYEKRILDLQLEQKLAVEGLTTKEKELNVSIYNQQLANLETQARTKERLAQLDMARLETARQLAALEGPRRVQDISRQGMAQLSGIGAQLANPFGGQTLDQFQQRLDQQTRYYETITPLERELSDLELTRQNIAKTASIEELAVQDKKIMDKQTELDLQRQILTELNAAEQTLLRQQQVYQKYGFIVNDVSKAFSDSISGIITGTTTVAEAFQRMFESIGKAFIDMATQLLAQQLFNTVFRALNPTPAASLVPGINIPLSGMPAGMAFAEGGFVTGPTRAVIGEGGEAEYVIPASKMRSAMGRYAAGARGASVIPSGSGDGAAMEATMTAAPIDVRYTVERINSVDYVTADQFQAGMRQAASQGAERGQQLALRRLQQSPSTRRRVGI